MGNSICKCKRKKPQLQRANNNIDSVQLPTTTTSRQSTETKIETQSAPARVVIPALRTHIISDHDDASNNRPVKHTKSLHTPRDSPNLSTITPVAIFNGDKTVVKIPNMCATQSCLKENNLSLIPPPSYKHTINYEKAAVFVAQRHDSCSNSQSSAVVHFASGSLGKLYAIRPCENCSSMYIAGEKHADGKTTEECPHRPILGKCVRHVPTFEQEIRVLMYLSKQEYAHPNLIRLLYCNTFHSATWTDGMCVLLLELCPGGDVCSLIELPEHRNGLPNSLWFRIMHQLLRGVAHLHFLGVAHRDIKPDNLIWDPSEQRLRIVDYGFAVVTADYKTNPLINLYSGTRAYSPPELFMGKTHNPFFHDIWSIGCTAYIMAFGKLPFGNDIANGNTIQLIFNHEPDYPVDNTDKFKQQLVVKCIKKNPAERCSVPELSDIVAEARSGFAQPSPV